MKLNYLTFVLCSKKYTPEDNRYYGRILSNESAYLTEYLLRALNTEFQFDCRRINLFCKDEDVQTGIIENDRIIFMDVKFDLSYFSMTSEEKEQYLFELLTSSMRTLCKIKDWNFALFEKHLIVLKNSGFKVEFYMERKKLCRNGSRIAKIFAIQSMYEIQFFVDFFEKRTLVQRKPLVTMSETRSMRYCWDINTIKWIDEKTVAVYNGDGTDVIYLTMDE